MMNELSNNLPNQPVIPNTSYEFRVNGRLTQETTTWFEDMILTVDETTFPPQTIIQGAIRDQSALYGIISRIRDLGLTLLSVNRVEEKEK